MVLELETSEGRFMYINVHINSSKAKVLMLLIPELRLIQLLAGGGVCVLSGYQHTPRFSSTHMQSLPGWRNRQAGQNSR